MEQLLPKDEVYFVADTNHVKRAMQIFGHEEVPAQSIVIIGAGNVGLQLSKSLEKKYLLKWIWIVVVVVKKIKINKIKYIHDVCVKFL